MMKASPDCFAICEVRLYDGTGNPPVPADVVVKDGRIAAVEPPRKLNLTGTEKISGSGLSLAPGFVDVHSPSDRSLIKAPGADSKITQGITTEVVGNCGSSAFWTKPEDIHETLTETGLKDHWKDLQTYAAAVEEARPAVNVGALCGHNTLRKLVTGNVDRVLTSSEMQQMKELLRESLEQGALGFSSGLIYFPGKYSDTDEVKELASVLRGSSKPYVTHMRSEGNQVLEALEEAFEIARSGSGKLQVSHIKATGPNNWGKAKTMVARIEEEQRNGLQIKADRYPYIFSHTNLLVSVPEPFNRIDGLTLQKQLQSSPERREELLQTMIKKGCIRGDWDNVICMNNDPQYRHFYGKPIETVAEALGLSVPELYVKFLTDYPRGGSAAYKTMLEENLHFFLSHDWCTPGTDASAIPMDGSMGLCHPRGFGTFPAFYQIAKKYAPVESVIRRMTSDPARFFNIFDRGLVKAGLAADLVLFDEETLSGQATLDNPTALSQGIAKVFVNGHLAYSAEEPSWRSYHGKFLKVKN
jgi:N-acyl-D-amino-acid deacylase